MLQVSCCPNGVPTGYTLFLPGEEQQEARVLTRAQMEAQIVVSLAGRWASGDLCPAVRALFHVLGLCAGESLGGTCSLSGGSLPAHQVCFLSQHSMREGIDMMLFAAVPIAHCSSQLFNSLPTADFGSPCIISRLPVSESPPAARPCLCVQVCREAGLWGRQGVHLRLRRRAGC